MNTYIDVFENITQSVEQLLTNNHSSFEIKQSATSLRDSVQPCFKELKQSASKLQELMKVGFNDLDHAEDVWNSKPRIVQAPTYEIWEQLGELSGLAFRVRILGNKCRLETVENAQNSWKNRIERLRTKWFIDAKKQLKKGVGWSDKEGFIRNIRLHVDLQSTEMLSIIKHSLSLVHQEITTTHLKLIQDSINLLNQQ